jgi:hypothetical protein
MCQPVHTTTKCLPQPSSVSQTHTHTHTHITFTHKYLLEYTVSEAIIFLEEYLSPESCMLLPVMQDICIDK